MSAFAQLSLFDALRSPPIKRHVKPHGDVVQGEPHEVLLLPHPRWAFPRCRIELHPHCDSTWMWSVSIASDDGTGTSYRVGEKWGNFAVTRDDALHYALKELETKLAGWASPCKSIPKIREWARSLMQDA